jgi:hypothetical protein
MKQQQRANPRDANWRVFTTNSFPSTIWSYRSVIVEGEKYFLGRIILSYNQLADGLY